jgi:hypothetical protein
VDDVDSWRLQPGHKVRTPDGAKAEILFETENGEWIEVRCLEAKDGTSVVGREDLVNEDEIKDTDQGC